MKQIYRQPTFLLRRAHQLSVGLFEQCCKELDLTPAQYGVLNVLKHTGGTDQGSLSKALGYDKVTTLHIVRVLEGRGWLTRVSSPVDRRRLDIAVTPLGLQALERGHQMVLQAQERLVAPLPPAQRERLLDLLDRLCEGLEATSRAPMSRLE